MQRNDNHASEEDDEVFRTRYLYQVGHAGRVVRVLLAWLLSSIGLLYAAWGLGLIFLGPAAVLLAFAGAGAKSRRLVVLFSLPTAIGICLAIYSLVRTPRGLPVTIAVTVVTTLVAVLVGGPRRHR
jgi:hypothetical protein